MNKLNLYERLSELNHLFDVAKDNKEKEQIIKKIHIIERKIDNYI